MKNLIVLFSIIFLLLNCKKKVKLTKTQINKSKLLRIDTLNNGFKVTNYYPDMYVLDIMYKKEIKDTPLESLAFGQYFSFGGESSKLYLSGFYKDGMKDSIWINVFDDYSIPKLTFYKNGKIQSKYNGKVSIYDDKGRIWIEGNSFESNKIPKGEWKFYRYDIGKILERKFKNEKDSIRVIQKKYELNTGNLIETNDFIEPNEEDSWN